MESWSYMAHLFLWTLPVIAGQWAIAHRIFLANAKAVFFPTLLGGTYFTIADYFAVRQGLWYFDPKQILGVYLGPLPIEEILFFYVVSLLVAQSFVMLLPEHLRHPAK